MIDLEKCIVCGTDEELNTSLSIKLEDESIDVQVCDQHAEDITVKRARELYQEKRDELDKIIAMAKAHGLEVTMPKSDSKLVTVEAPTPEPATVAEQPVKQEPQDKPVVRADDEGNMVDAVEAQRRLGTPRSMTTNLGSMGRVESQQPHNPQTITEKVDLGQTRTKVGMVEGRGGQPVAIPTVMKDESGTTVVRVNQNMTDHELQRQFKGLAHTKDADGNNVHCYGADGYSMRPCGFCRGSGFVTDIKNKQRRRMECPKCDGAGILSFRF